MKIPKHSPRAYLRRLSVVVVGMVLLCPGLLSAAEESDEAPVSAAAIQFQGSSSFADGVLHTALLDSEERIKEGGLTAPRADDAAFYLERFYRDNGFTHAVVSWEIRGAQLVLEVNEGQPVTVGEVIFEGKHPELDEESHSSFLLGATRKRFSRFRSDLPFVRSEIASGIDGLQRYYHSQGFLDAVVDVPALHEPAPTEGSIKLVVEIDFGARYTFARPILTGDQVIPIADWPKEVVELLQGHYAETNLREAETELVKFYQQHGYYSVEVTIDADPLQHQGYVVPLSVQVSSGPLYRIGTIKMDNVDARVLRFVRSEFSKLEGQPFVRDELRGTYRKMLTSGVMGYFRVKEEPDGNGVLNLDVTAQEAKTKEASVYLGFDTALGAVVRLGYTDRNIFGSTTSLGGWAEYTSNGILGRITYRNRWFLNEKYPLKIEATVRQRDWDGYVARNGLLEASVERVVTERFKWGVALRLKATKLQEVEITPIELVGLDPYILGGVALSARYDARDDPLLPTKGYIFALMGETASSGADQSFLRAAARFSYLIPIGKTNLSFGARAGTIFALSEPEDISIEERFFNGGPSTVRSFDYRFLGPKDLNGNPIGGLTSTILNVEYTFPVAGPLHLAVFGDAGSLTSEAGAPETDDFRYAVGLGLRFRLPIGPLRFDYGYNPDRREGEASGAFHFAFGFAF